MVDKNFESSGITVPNNHVSALYNQYAGMLLGYIFEVVKNMTVAEQYLIAVFKDVPYELGELTKPGSNVFCQLQIIARKKLAGFFDSVHNCEDGAERRPAIANTNNKYIGTMNSEQQLVFCGIYWHGKTISRLAIELDKTEDAVKKILKECFTTIRNSSR